MGILFVDQGTFGVLENSVVPQLFALCWIVLGYALLNSCPLPEAGLANETRLK